MRYFTLGLNIFFETCEDNLFSFHFKNGRLETRSTVSDNVKILAEQVSKYEYTKQLEKRVYFFSKKFK